MQASRPQAFLQTAVAALRSASRLVMQNMDRLDRLNPEPHRVFGTVSILDSRIEEHLLEALQERYPSHSFHGKHHGLSHRASRDFHWQIDGLCGTANFFSGIPTMAQSLALSYQGQPVIAALYQPCTDDLYTTIVGNSSKCNDRRIRCRMHHHQTQPSLLCLENTLTPPSVIDVDSFLGVRQMGCPAMSLMQIATGQADVVMMENIHPCEYAAAAVIAKEAKVSLHSTPINADSLIKRVIAIGHEQYLSLKSAL